MDTGIGRPFFWMRSKVSGLSGASACCTSAFTSLPSEFQIALVPVLRLRLEGNSVGVHKEFDLHVSVAVWRHRTCVEQNASGNNIFLQGRVHLPFATLAPFLRVGGVVPAPMPHN